MWLAAALLVAEVFVGGLKQTKLWSWCVVIRMPSWLPAGNVIVNACGCVELTNCVCGGRGPSGRGGCSGPRCATVW